MFGVRNTFAPSAPVAGEFVCGSDDVTPMEGTVISGFSCCAAGTALSIDAGLRAKDDSCPYPVAVEEVPQTAAYSSVAMVMGRGADGRLAFCNATWSRFHRAFTFGKVSEGSVPSPKLSYRLIKP